MHVKEHYDNHLSHIYSWMVGDFTLNVQDFIVLLKEHKVYPTTTRTAIDLGAGHGIQSMALAKLGFEVIAVDFNEKLLNELKENVKGYPVSTLQADISDFKGFGNVNPELIVCCGDTITHLDNKRKIEALIADCERTLSENGKLMLSFRDYSKEQLHAQRFIPVKSDESRILTCALYYRDEKVTVTDLLYEKSENKWDLKVSSYEKIRVSTEEVIAMLQEHEMEIVFKVTKKGLVTIMAQKIKAS